MIGRWLTPLVGALAVVPLCAQRAGDLPAYRPEQRVTGAIRSWGNDRMLALMKRWEAGFRRFHPDATFETKLMGTGTGMAGLHTGVADLALMGRESNSTEDMAFEWVFRYKPLGVQVGTGSAGSPGKSYAPAILVHRDNPLASLTMVQLDAVFGCEHRRGAKNVRTWGELGLTGEWASRPIHVYAPDVQASTGAFFREVVLKDSYKWSCEMTEFAGPFPGRERADPDDGVREVVEALARDRAGIALSALGVATPAVKPVALSAEDGGPAFAPTPANVAARRYPLSRAVWIYVNREPKAPLEPKVAEFLRYVLSREGQQEVERGGDYLPLPAVVLVEQLRRLR